VIAVRTVTAWWERTWFAPARAPNLAAARIIIALHALWIVLSRDYAATAGLPRAFWDEVDLTLRLRYLVVPGQPLLEHVLVVLTVIGLVGVALGVAPRVTCLASALLLYHLAPLEVILWTASPYERGLEISVIALVVLAVAPSADAWSVSSRSEDPERVATGAYRWPLVLIQLLLAQIYLFAGYSKLVRAGLGWVSADNLRRWLLVFSQQDQVVVFHGLGGWIADRPAVALAAAVFAMLLDLGFILAVFWPKARWIVLPAALAFHTGIVLSMNIVFLNLPQLLVFVDWEAIARRAGSRRAGGAVLRPSPHPDKLPA
jgi:hypothetical protein